MANNVRQGKSASFWARFLCRDKIPNQWTKLFARLEVARTGHSTLLMAVIIPPNGTTGMLFRTMNIETRLAIGEKYEEKYAGTTP